MLFRKTTAVVLTATLTLNGCTVMLWGMNDPFSKTTTLHTVAKDRIHAFGTVAKDNPQLEKGSLVMMGGTYWFVVNPEDSAKLAGVLNVKLDKPFQTVQHNPRFEHKALPVELESPESQNFSSDFCLRYDTAKAADIAKLTQIGFKPFELDGKTIYTRCVSARGTYYATPQNLKADYRFEQSIPVELYYPVTKKHTDGWKLAGNILQTPLTLALDAVGAVVMLPVAALGAISDAAKKASLDKK